MDALMDDFDDLLSPDTAGATPTAADPAMAAESAPAPAAGMAGSPNPEPPSSD
eukprot:COSAG05_NODE_15602_length_365_cov_1.537594_1_plen_52_part_10